MAIHPDKRASINPNDRKSTLQPSVKPQERRLSFIQRVGSLFRKRAVDSQIEPPQVIVKMPEPDVPMIVIPKTEAKKSVSPVQSHKTSPEIYQAPSDDKIRKALIEKENTEKSRIEAMKPEDVQKYIADKLKSLHAHTNDSKTQEEISEVIDYLGLNPEGGEDLQDTLEMTTTALTLLDPKHQDVRLAKFAANSLKKRNLQEVSGNDREEVVDLREEEENEPTIPSGYKEAPIETTETWDASKFPWADARLNTKIPLKLATLSTTSGAQFYLGNAIGINSKLQTAFDDLSPSGKSAANKSFLKAAADFAQAIAEHTKPHAKAFRAAYVKNVFKSISSGSGTRFEFARVEDINDKPVFILVDASTEKRRVAVYTTISSLTEKQIRQKYD